MKTFSKKVISIILSIIFIFSAVSVAFASETVDRIPLVYVGGQGSPIVVDEPDGSERTIYPITLPDDFIEKTVKENIGVFTKAFFTQHWDEFCDVVYEIFSDLFCELKLDENGNPVNNSRTFWTWEKGNPVAEPLRESASYVKYEFYYDWRLDPYTIADNLHEFIEDVRAVTGHKKVALLGRCLGACVVAAYMDKYGSECVSDLIFYASALNGATQCSKAFCGDFYIDADGVERYLYDIDISSDLNINSLIQSFVTMCNDTLGLDFACWSVNNVYSKIYMDILPRLLMDTYGTFPGFWSMVSHEDYLKAKKTVFYGADMQKYANFIKIIDNYHYNVQHKAKKNIKSYIKNGIEVSDIVKYGYQTVPVTRDGAVLSDDVCDVYSASMGATTTELTEQFSEKYLKNAAKTGTDKFISLDRHIDASTCLIPERTWFIKNLEHRDFPDIIENLIDEIIKNDGFTVFSDKNYPQYLVYSKTDEEETLQPMSAENQATYKKYKVSFFKALFNFIKSLFKFLNSKISNLISTQK